MTPRSALLRLHARRLLLGSLAVLLGAVGACPASAEAVPASLPSGRWVELRVPLPARPGASRQARGRVIVYVPASRKQGPVPLLLALHGWNGRPEEWQRPAVAALAERHGVAVACPAMGRSVYESRFYPESRGAEGMIPGAPLVGELLLPFLRSRLPVRQDRAGTGVAGYSTGGRGALVLAGRYDEFAFAASLSGTYDLGLLDRREGEYAIHAAVFGPRSRFRERWTDEDVIGAPRSAALGRVRLYVAHGGKDRVVRPNQLEALRRFFAQRGIAARLVLDEEAGHDWRFWEKQLGAVFEEFARRASAE